MTTLSKEREMNFRTLREYSFNKVAQAILHGTSHVNQELRGRRETCCLEQETYKKTGHQENRSEEHICRKEKKQDQGCDLNRAE